MAVIVYRIKWPLEATWDDADRLRSPFEQSSAESFGGGVHVVANLGGRPGVLTVMTVLSEVERCIATEYGRLVGAIALIAGSRPLAEEAVQEAFAKAWERAQRGQTFDHLAGWVATVALNHVRSGFRRSSNERRAMSRLSASPALAGEPAVDVALTVRSAIDGLARRQRDAVVLYYLLDLDIATTARLLDVSEGTVKSALARARAILAGVLDDQELEN